ncbi:MAG: HAD-IIB family hydrolase [Culicoidibacterales bacterium]
MKKYLFCDIDGTISTEENLINEEIKELINNSKDIEIVLATGRNSSYVRNLGLKVDAICSNGCEILYKNGDIEQISSLTIAQIQEIEKINKKFNFTYLLVTCEGNIIEETAEVIKTIINLSRMHRNNPETFFCAMNSYYYSIYLNSIKAKSPLEYIHAKNLSVNKIEIFTDMDKEELKQHYQTIKGVSVSSSHISYLEIVPENGNKVYAIEKYIPRDINNYKTYAIGDEVNDLNMLSHVDYSFAVANANPDVLKIANQVVASVDENGFKEALEIIRKEKELEGGRVGKIYRVDNKVVRPSNLWSTTVHDFLNFCIQEGVNFVPIPYELNDQREVVSFIEGDVFNDEFPENINVNELIVSAAELLRKFHDISEKYIEKLTGLEIWMLPPIAPVEVICHGDFAPYNTVVNKGKATAIIDFDTIHPGTHLWDIAYGVYRWSSIVDKDNFEKGLAEAKLFLDSYGADNHSRNNLIKVTIERLEALVEFMRKEAANGNEDFIRNIQDGHLNQYIEDINFLKNNEKRITNELR